MEDQELLELAAKAAGYRYFPEGYDENMDDPCIEVDGFPWVWMPLRDDDTALRLAVDCCLFESFDFCQLLSAAQSKDDPYAATRRAIVRAAAELGLRSNVADKRPGTVLRDGSA